MDRKNIGREVRLVVRDKLFTSRSGVNVVLQEVANGDVQDIAYEGLWRILHVHTFFKAILKNDLRENFHRHHKRLLIENRTP